jgi:hypothetical protein
VTNKIYAANEDSNNVMVLTEQQVQTIPLTTTISSLPGNQTSNPTPTFTFTASSTFSPDALPPDAVYFQVDTWQGAWTPATATTPPGTFTGTLAGLLPGVHILYAYATDGQDSISIQGDGGASEQSGPLVGNITAYLFLVTPGPGLPMLENLHGRVHSLGLPHGIENSLLAKLENARASFEAGDIPATCGQLGAFINEVRAQAGHAIPVAVANELIDAASEIKGILGCS